MNRLLALAVARLLAITVIALAATPYATADDQRCLAPATPTGPRIGLVLGGGGARGAAHIGVIRRLEELKVPVHAVAGTSMGSLVGGFLATGMTAAELQDTVQGIDFQALFKDATVRGKESLRRKRDDDLGLFGPKLGVGKDSQLLPRGAVHGQKISLLFEALVSQRTRQTNFDRLPIPYRAVAADIESGAAVILANGSLAQAMRASMSVPGVFDPVTWGDHLLVDGGIADNLPIDVARSLGVDVVIAVEVGTPPATRSELSNMATIVGQLSNLMIAKNTRAQLATLTERDVLIRPPLGSEISSAEFSESTAAIEIGYAAAVAASDQLARYAIAPQDYREYRRQLAACVPGEAEFTFAELDNRSRFSHEVIWRQLGIDPAGPIARDTLNAGIERVYGLGFLDLVRPQVVERGDQSGVIVTVEQDARGTKFIEWGLDVNSDGDDSDISLRAGYLKTDMDERGSEFRIVGEVGDKPGLAAEIYKALDPGLRWYLRPQIQLDTREFPIFDSRNNLRDILTARQVNESIALIREFRNGSALWGGIALYQGSTEDEFGTRGDLTQEYDGAEYLAGYEFDSMDNRYFPTRGQVARLTYRDSAPALGADAAFEQVMTSLLAARTWGRHTLIGSARFNTTLNGDAPYYAQFHGGGPFNLSGLKEDQLSGNHYALALASWRYQLTSGGGLFPAQAGVSVEYGNAADRRGDLFDDAFAAGSLYFGYESPLGPLYWGVGFAEGGERAYFLKIGDIFSGSSISR